jgi:hypothetical protein
MKKILVVSFLLTIFLSSFTAQMIPTSLKITVRNELGGLESGVNVTLYANKDDYNKSTNAVAAGKTDEKGNVFFQHLTQLNFYVSAEKGDKNNFGAGEKIDSLAANKVNKVTLIISD